MSSGAHQHPPLSILMVIFGTGIFVFAFSLIYCCYFISTSQLKQSLQVPIVSILFVPGAILGCGQQPNNLDKLRFQAQQERFGYKVVMFKEDSNKLNLIGTCAVCLEDFRPKEELGVLPCQHAFHRRCLVKWLEVRCVCPMCNKPIAGRPEQRHSLGTLLDELV